MRDETAITISQIDPCRHVFRVTGRFRFTRFNSPNRGDVWFSHISRAYSFTLRREDADRAELSYDPERSYWFCIEVTMSEDSPADRPGMVNDVRIVSVSS